MKLIIGLLTVCGLAAAQSAQAPSPIQSTGNAAQTGTGSMPIYRVTVVARTMKAINYNHRSGPTRIDFRGVSGEQARRDQDRCAYGKTAARH
jgi:hypothetical protein